MNTCAAFILFPTNTTIDNLVLFLFKKGYGIAPFGEKHTLSDNHSPADLCALLIMHNKPFSAQELKEQITTFLCEKEIAFYSVIVCVGHGAVDYAWSASNLIQRDNKTETTNNKKSSVSYLRLVEPTSNSEEFKEEVIEPIIESKQEEQIASEPNTPQEPNP
jgi:hypothetical protein